MRKLYTTLLCFILVFNYTLLIGQNQKPNNRKEQYESQKVAYLSKNMNLSVSEAQQFWPVYNEMQQEKQKLQQTKKKITQQIRQGNKTITDKELEKLVDKLIELRVIECQLAKQYHEKFKSVLPIRKVLKYYQSEEQFKAHIVREMRNNNRQNPPQRNR